MTIHKALAPEWYVDPSIYQKERSLIFESAWWLMGPAHTLSQPGDYLCDTICGWPVFVLHSGDGELRAFLNVCRHRGASLLQVGHGNVDSIRCPYHGWLYDDLGNFLKAPRFGVDLDDYCEDLALRHIDLHVWNELVFVKINPDGGSDFNEWIGEVAALSESFPSPADLGYHGEFTVTGELNWKAYCDNTVEGYHLNLIHPRLGKALAGGATELISVNNGRSVVFDITHGSGGGGQGLRGRKGMWIYHFPGLQLVLGEKVFKAERVESESSNHVRSKNWAWYSGLNAEEREDAFQWAKQIVEEDFGICSQVTRNMRAGSYVPGPLSPVMENHVARIQEIIRDLLNNCTIP